MAEAGQTPPQEVRLTGTVTDQRGEPIIGANIVVLGTTLGTVTNMDGGYSIALPQGSLLRFSYIGYLEQKYYITNQDRDERAAV